MLEKVKGVFIGFIVLIAVILAVLTGCAKEAKVVYIPTKCKPKPLVKPTPTQEQSTAEQVAEVFAYTEMLERDLEFCKGE